MKLKYTGLVVISLLFIMITGCAGTGKLVTRSGEILQNGYKKAKNYISEDEKPVEKKPEENKEPEVKSAVEKDEKVSVPSPEQEKLQEEKRPVEDKQPVKEPEPVIEIQKVEEGAKPVKVEPKKSEQAPAVSSDRTINVNPKVMKFMPDKMVIKAGETVKWVNKDHVKHNFVSIPDENGGEPVIFHLSPPGDVWEYTFYEPGKYQYYCFIHSRMTGEIVVLPE